MKTLLFLMILIWFTGCSGMTGGPCEYEQINGIATIVSNDGNITMAVFKPDKYAKKIAWLREGDLFHLQQRIDGKKGSNYFATMHVITKGTCTPLQLVIPCEDLNDKK